MSPPKRRYLHRKLATDALLVALLFSVFIAAVSFLVEFQRVSERNRVILGQLLDTVESTAAIAAYSGNRAVGEDVLKGLLRNDIVHEARLFAERRLDLRQARDGSAPAPEAVARTLRSPFGEGEAVGTLSLVPDAEFNLGEARRRALGNALDLGLAVGLTALMLLVLVKSSLSRPLQKVSDALHRIKVGEKERLETLPQHQDDELGQLVRDINALLDTAQEKFAEERRLLLQIQAVERQLRGIFENSSAGIFLLDGAGRLQTANPTLGKALGLTEEDVQGLRGRSFPELAFAEPTQFHALMRQADQTGQAAAADLELRTRHPSAWVHCLLSKYAGGEGAARYEGVVYDITERRAGEMRARHEADHDPLTNLLRRHAVERELARLLEAPPRGEGRHIVLLMDLDNFKDINDSHGHAAGDAVLVATARRIKSCVRAGDLAARLGGDEFLVVLVDCISAERAREIARHIVAAATLPIPLGGEARGQVGISIGLAIQGPDCGTVSALFEAADAAMYEVKRRGKNGFGLAGPDGSVRVEKVAAGRAG